MRAVLLIGDPVLSDTLRGLLALAGMEILPEEEAGAGDVFLLDAASAGAFVPPGGEPAGDGRFVLLFSGDSPDELSGAPLLPGWTRLSRPISFAAVYEALRAPSPAPPDRPQVPARVPSPADEAPAREAGTGPAEEPPTLFVRERAVAYRGERAVLTAREFALFSALLRGRGEPVPRETLLREAWGGGENVRANTADVYAGYLRRKLRPLFGDGVILSRRNVGYSLHLPEEMRIR